MRTTLELPDPLFARLKARAASEGVSLKKLLHRYVEKGLNTPPSETSLRRSAAGLPRLEVPFVREAGSLSNAALFDLYREFAQDDLPGIRRTAELVVA
nr:hypothetical protein [Synechococcus sp. HK01-R]